MDLRPEIDAALEAFGLEATVTVPDAEAVKATVFWLPSTAPDVPDGQAPFRRAEQRRELVLPVDDVPQVPRGTIITVAEYEGGTPRSWRVDAMEKPDYDHHRVIVVPVADS